MKVGLCEICAIDELCEIWNIDELWEMMNHDMLTCKWLHDNDKVMNNDWIDYDVVYR